MRDDEAKRRTCTEEIFVRLNLSGELNHSLVRLRSLFKDFCRSQTGFTYVELPMADKNLNCGGRKKPKTFFSRFPFSFPFFLLLLSLILAFYFKINFFGGWGGRGN